MTMTLPLGSAIYLDSTYNAATPVWNAISEHNRAPISVDVMRIEKSQRMANGTLRKIFIADKKTISTSWTMLPSYSTMTVDGKWGALDIKSFYENQGKGVVRLKISPNNTTDREQTIYMAFTSASFTMVKRNVKTGTTFKNATVTAINYATGVTTYTASNQFAAGDKVTITGATFPAYNGTFTIASATTTAFTVAGTVAGTPTTSKAVAVTALPDAQEFWDVSITLEEV
jgi:hypothetical protein